MSPLRRLRPPSPPEWGAKIDASDEASQLAWLMERAGRGDEQAFSQIYDQLAGLVYGIVRRVVRDPAQSQEVAQEVFLEIWRLAPRHDRARGSVRSWVATIAHRRAVDRVRAEQAARDREQRQHRLDPSPTDTVAEEIDDRFEHDRVRRALSKLTDAQREALELAYYGGYTYREVAMMLRTPHGTVKTRIRDGLIRLRDQLGVIA
jgi:RNA polymerase sigma-70 factor (ECF subfamily)